MNAFPRAAIAEWFMKLAAIAVESEKNCAENIVNFSIKIDDYENGGNRIEDGWYSYVNRYTLCRNYPHSSSNSHWSAWIAIYDLNKFQFDMGVMDAYRNVSRYDKKQILEFLKILFKIFLQLQIN